MTSSHSLKKHSESSIDEELEGLGLTALAREWRMASNDRGFRCIQGGRAPEVKPTRYYYNEVSSRCKELVADVYVILGDADTEKNDYTGQPYLDVYLLNSVKDLIKREVNSLVTHIEDMVRERSPIYREFNELED